MLKKIIDKCFVQPFKTHLVLSMIFAGVGLITISSVFGDHLNSFIWSGASETLVNISSAILGGGVFAAIMKSSQFSEIFMNNLSNVVYSPSKVFSNEETMKRWTLLTEALLQPVLPTQYQMATAEIKKQFFEYELKYHFESLESKYDIEVQSDGVNAEVKQSTHVKVVAAPDSESITIKQSFLSDSVISLKDVFINGQKVDIEKCFSVDKENKSLHHFELVIDEKKFIDNGNGDRYVIMNRNYEFSHSLRDDPNMIVELNRYVKGLIVKVKINGPGTFDLKRIGSSLESEVSPDVCSEGWKWYTLAREDNLLLPGKGYTLTIVGNDHKVQPAEGV